MLKESPCKECPNKGCGVYHDECIEYQGWKDEREEIKAKARGEAEAKQFLMERVLDTNDFMRKFRGK